MLGEVRWTRSYSFRFGFMRIAVALDRLGRSLACVRSIQHFNGSQVWSQLITILFQISVLITARLLMSCSLKCLVC